MGARANFRDEVEILQVDPVTGKRTGLAPLVRRALRALNGADVPFAVIGATALAVRACRG
jgi:hypothetical protein